MDEAEIHRRIDAVWRLEAGVSDRHIDPGGARPGLGAGLGHVPLLAAICCGTRCIGVERESAYVLRAARRH